LLACIIYLLDKLCYNLKSRRWDKKILKAMPLLSSLFSFFTLPTSTLTDLQSYIGGLVTDTSLLWILAIALPVGFWIIYKIVSVVKRGTR
jgi:hypothetical protein